MDMNSRFNSGLKTISMLVLGATMSLLPVAGWGLKAQSGDSTSASGTTKGSSAKQDMKTAGKDTANATKSAGKGVKKGTVGAYHATKKGTTTAAKKVGSTTKGAVKGGEAGAKKPADTQQSQSSTPQSH
jgi:hypothetical protein